MSNLDGNNRKNSTSNEAIINSKLDNNIQSFIEGVFSLQTRRFGTLAELVILEKYNLSSKTDNQHYDATDSKGKKIEIKFSRALRSNNNKITKNNILKETVYSAIHNRALSHNDFIDESFDSNIQQIKRCEFDILYYGLYFIDKVAVFTVNSEDVENIKGYSNFQHKGNEGEGQFHINANTIDYHMDNHFLEWITYQDIYSMFSSLQK